MPDAVRARLASQLAPYRARHELVRWTRPQSWHLTLLFLGSVRPDRVGEVQALMTEAAAAAGPYHVRVELGGGRTRRDEGVAWLGLAEGAGTLLALARDMADACPPGLTMGPPAKRTPSAHLTVARRADQTVIEALRHSSLGPLGVDWTVDRLALVRSHLQPGGARYETVSEVTL